MFKNIKGAIFDLDGVLVDTASYHYLAWKRLAQELGFNFSEQDNEALKGVSRIHSLEILLNIGHITGTEQQKVNWAAQKNKWYVDYLYTLTPEHVLDYVPETLNWFRQRNFLTAIGSASKNTPLILERTNLCHYFDAVIDGNSTTKAKPDPEVFLLGAQKLGLEPEQCIVFEDSLAGIQAANHAGMTSVYLGIPTDSSGADIIISSLREFPFSALEQ